MATSGTRRILHIEAEALSAINSKQMAFETNSDLSYFYTNNGFWGGKNSFGDVSRFAGFDEAVRFKKIYFEEQAIVISINALADESMASTTRVANSINIGLRAGMNVTNPACNIGEDAGKASINGILEGTGIHIGWHTGWNANGLASISIGNGANVDMIGNDNISIGKETGGGLSGNNNVVVGKWSGIHATQDNTVMLGTNVGWLSSGAENVYIGWDTATYSQGGHNVIVGRSAGINLSGSFNNVMGWAAGVRVLGNNNLLLGANAGSQSSGADNIIIGEGAGYTLSGSDNIIIGEDSGVYLSGIDNIIIGEGAGWFTSGSRNICVGLYAGETTTIANYDNIMIGQLAGSSAHGNQFSDMVIIGKDAGTKMAISQRNVIIGTSAATDAALSFSQIIGDLAGIGSYGLSNIGIGQSSLKHTSGDYNIAIGLNALSGGVPDVDNCIAIGQDAGLANIGDYCVFIGKEAGLGNTEDEKLEIKQNGTSLIRGDFSTKEVEVDYLILSGVDALPSVSADYGKIYSSAIGGTAEVFVLDGAGNETRISPHNEEGDWEYYSVNRISGKVMRVNMKKFIKRMEEITGELFIEEY